MGKDTTVNFRVATRSYVDERINVRDGETKLGTHIQLLATDDWAQELNRHPAKYVLLGIPEDIGVRANGGVGGTHTLWEPFLKAFLNTQQTDTLRGEEMILLGAFDADALMEQSLSASASELREMVTLIDAAVYPIIEAIVAAGKLPIVIGGGHNNAYPLLKGTATAYGQSIHCINLDAHSDYRVMEGRHSGNGFRYAKQEGYLQRYAMIGLHRNYNSHAIVQDIANDAALQASFYEDIFLEDGGSFKAAVQQAIAHTTGRPTGIELDLDCIERTLSSATTPCGITPLQARQYLQACKQTDIAYIHIAEGAVQLRDGRTDSSTAKLVSYLVSDVLRNRP